MTHFMANAVHEVIEEIVFCCAVIEKTCNYACEPITRKFNDLNMFQGENMKRENFNSFFQIVKLRPRCEKRKREFFFVSIKNKLVIFTHRREL